MDGKIKCKHLWTHSVKWKNGFWGRCGNNNRHIHDLADQIVVYCYYCKELYEKTKRMKTFDDFINNLLSKGTNPEKINKKAW